MSASSSQARFLVAQNSVVKKISIPSTAYMQEHRKPSPKITVVSDLIMLRHNTAPTNSGLMCFQRLLPTHRLPFLPPQFSRLPSYLTFLSSSSELPNLQLRNKDF